MCFLLSGTPNTELYTLTLHDALAIRDGDRHFRAYDGATGEVLWKGRLPTSAQGFPITYAADGEQYIAVQAGLGGGSPRFVPDRLAPEIRLPRSGNGLFVFKLPPGSADRRPGVEEE